jgi:hypothetical protein
LVPWKPCVPIALLQYWPVVVEDLQRRASVAAREPPAAQDAPITLTDATKIIPGPSSGVVVAFSEECANLFTSSFYQPRPIKCDSSGQHNTSSLEEESSHKSFTAGWSLQPSNSHCSYKRQA